MAQSPWMDFKVNTHTHTLPFSLHETQSQHTGNKECFLITRHMLHIKTLEVQLHIIQLWWLCGNTHTETLKSSSEDNYLQMGDALGWKCCCHTRTDTLRSDEKKSLAPQQQQLLHHAEETFCIYNVHRLWHRTECWWKRQESTEEIPGVCVSVRERGEKENPGGINSSYRNSSGLVSASVLG